MQLSRLFVAGLMALVLSACAGAGEASKDGGRNDAENITDYSVCSQPPFANNIRGAWRVDRASEDISYTFVMTIGNTSTQARNTCRMGNRQVSASVTVSSGFTFNMFRFLSSDGDQQTIRGQDFELNCDVAINKAEMKYRFQGRCLVLENEGIEEVFVPAY